MAKIEPATMEKLNRKNANVNAELAHLRAARDVLEALAPVWDLPPNLLDQYLAKDAAAMFVFKELAPLMPRTT